MNKPSFWTTLFALGMIAVSPATRGQVTVQVISPGSQIHNSLSVSSTDLANNGQSTFSTVSLTSGTALFSSAVANLVNGTMGPVYETGNFGNTGGAETFTPSNGAVVTLTFDTSINTAGYDLSQIAVYTGSDPGGPRSKQNYTVAWAAPGSSSYSTFATITNVGDETQDLELETRIYDAASGNIATGVGSLQFTFSNTNSSLPESLYREIDVTGMAVAIPEPATYAIFAGIAVLGLAAVRRRQRVA